MNSPTSTAMGVVFLLLALFFVWLAWSPRRRCKCTWGRTQSAVPMSALGMSAWIGSFLLIAAAAFGLLPYAVIFGVVPIIAVAGCYDAYRQAKHKAREKDPGREA